MAKTLIDEAAHLAKFGTTLTLGKSAVMQAEHVAAGAVAGTSGTMFGLVVMPLVVGVSAVLAQIEHQHYRDNLRDEFGDEIAAKTGKQRSQVVDSDLDVAAKENKALRRSLENSRKDRNNLVILSIISSVVSMAAVKFLSGIGLPLAGLDETLAGMMIKVAAGVGTYLTVKRPLHWLVDRINGLEEPTVADKSVTLARAHEKGVTISQEKLFELYMDASPELGKAIKQEYGKAYEKMNRRMREVVLQEYGAMIGLPEIAADINAGRVKATELAFAAYGEQSGVKLREHGEPSPETPEHWTTQLINYCGGKLKTLQHQKQSAVVGEHLPANVDSVPDAPLMEPPTPAERIQALNESQKSFVERVGRKHVAEIAAGHVERLAMQQQADLPTQTVR